MNAFEVRLDVEASDNLLESSSDDVNESSDVSEVKSDNPLLNTGISDSSTSVVSRKSKPWTSMSVHISLSLDFGESFCPPSPVSVWGRSDSDRPDETDLDSERFITRRGLFLIDVVGTTQGDDG